MPTIDLPVRYFKFFPGDAPIGSTPKNVQLAPDETALLLIDVYHAAEKPEAKDLVNTTWDAAWWRVVNENIQPLIASARRLGMPVVYITNSSPRISIGRSAYGERLRESLGFDPEVDFRETSVDPLEFNAGEPIQLTIPPQMAPEPGDHYVRKHTYSGFFETRLDSVLRNLGVKNLICAGFVADCCVLFTVADAVFRGYNTVLMRDCTLAAELPQEVDSFTQTARTILWMETFLCPTSTSAEFVLGAGQPA